jgi:ketoreductase RED1
MTLRSTNSTTKSSPSTAAEKNTRIAVIGCGVIGTSWTALFLASGREVSVYDPAPDAEIRIRRGIAEIAPRLASLGYRTASIEKRLRIHADLASAVRDAGIVQENGPERVAFKRTLWEEIEAHARPDALLLSSSSSIRATVQSSGMRNPSRMLIGHPFNPPHLVPLVEVAPGRRTSAEAVEAAVSFYRSVGKHPVVLRKEVPGFVANRLQGALFRESVSLVKSGVVTVDELDDIVTHSLGQRWATGGPFLSFHIGGGPTGFSGYLKQFAMRMQLLWLQIQVTPVFFNRSVQRKLLGQIGASFGRTPIAELEARRDISQIAVLKSLRASESQKTKGKK